MSAESGVGRRRPVLGVQRIRPAYMQVAEQLRQLVIRGELAPGSRLPSEADLSVMFGVSRSTVREALRALSSQNLLQTSRGVTGGSFIALPDPGQVSDQLEVGIGLLSADLIGVDDLIEARELLEVPASRLAAQRRTSDELAVIEAAMQSNDLLQTGHIAGHQQFHDAILQAAHNQLLEVMTRPIFNVLQSRVMGNAADREFWDSVEADHVRILKAIVAGDAERAATEMYAHLEHLRPTYERVYAHNATAQRVDQQSGNRHAAARAALTAPTRRREL